MGFGVQGFDFVPEYASLKNARALALVEGVEGACKLEGGTGEELFSHEFYLG